MTYRQKGKSFHITQQFGESWIIMWPPASFGLYTDDKSLATKELRSLRKNESDSKFRLVSYDAVRDEQKNIVGIVQGTLRDESE